MAKIYDSITELVGDTPLVRLHRYEKLENLEANILGKFEYFNPSGSVKDRAALNIIEEAEKRGDIKPGMTLVDYTSGNTGIGLSMCAAVMGLKIIICMPESMSIERRKTMTAYGAELVLTEGSKGMRGAIEKASELASEIPDSFIAGQFVNPSNPQIHRKTTGPEIWQDTGGKVDIFIAGVGTGGTLTGTAEYLKSQNSNIKVIAVEPFNSPVLSAGEPMRSPSKIIPFSSTRYAFILLLYSVAAITAFIVCIRFSASSKTID